MDETRGARAVSLGAHQAFPAGARLPERVDAVMESVGAATWSHSINVLRPGGTLVICGATSGDNPSKAELTKIYFKPLRVIGSTMGTRDELISLTKMLVATGIRPHIDRIEDFAPAKADPHDWWSRIRSRAWRGRKWIASP
jgi:NADPH:quinone reductase-like Zn-dependent oxidoreductase